MKRDQMADTRAGQIRVARQILGLATIVLILSLAAGEAFLGVMVPPGRLPLLVGLAGALLGLDAARDLGE